MQSEAAAPRAEAAGLKPPANRNPFSGEHPWQLTAPSPGHPAPAGEATLEGGSYEVIRAPPARAGGGARRPRPRPSTRGARSSSAAPSSTSSATSASAPRTTASRATSSASGSTCSSASTSSSGLKTETAVSDVFSLHSFEKTAEGVRSLRRCPPTEAGGFLADEVRQGLRDSTSTTRTRGSCSCSAPRRALLAVVPDRRDARATSRSSAWRRAGGPRHLHGQPRRARPRLPAVARLRVDADHARELRAGPHPHVNILDRCSSRRSKGDLTVKVENNTKDGQGIYREPVDDANQSLDDAEYRLREGGRADPAAHHAVPREDVPLPRVQHAHAARGAHRRHRPGVLRAARGPRHRLPRRLLPADAATTRSSTARREGMEFTSASSRSPNGEDVLYVFHRRDEGAYVLFPYNLIRKEVQNPLQCHGYSLFADGRHGDLPRHVDEPTRVHPHADLADAVRHRRARRRGARRAAATWARSATRSWCAASPTRSRCRALAKTDKPDARAPTRTWSPRSRARSTRTTGSAHAEAGDSSDAHRA